jgi:hypothetical protein
MKLEIGIFYFSFDKDGFCFEIDKTPIAFTVFFTTNYMRV